jgi:hypothetical protein
MSSSIAGRCLTWLLLGSSLELSSESVPAQGPLPPAFDGATPGTSAVPVPTGADMATAPQEYSLPFHLRPVTAATVVRSESSFASYERMNPKSGLVSTGGLAFVSSLLGSWRIPGTGDNPGTGLAPLVKLTVAGDSPPVFNVAGDDAFVNPLVVASYAARSRPGDPQTIDSNCLFGDEWPIDINK